MKRILTLCLLTGSLVTAQAQTPITITQAQFPATAASIDEYQLAGTTGLIAPALGPNRTWDYRSLTPQGSGSAGTYTAVVGTPPFAGSVRTYGYTTRAGTFTILVTAYEGFDASGFSQIGAGLAAQSFSLTAKTGGPNDVLIVPAQNVAVNLLRVPLPLTSTTRVTQFSRAIYNTQLTVQSLGLNQASFRNVQRSTVVDSVAGWGTLRVPVAGNAAGSAAMPVLLVQRRYAVQDSFYLGNQPATAALLSALGVTQGAISRTYTHSFYRQNSAQYMLRLFYADSRFNAPTSASYSAEPTLPLAAATAREMASGGLTAWPNPAGSAQPLSFSLATAAPGQALQLTLRDATGRVVSRTAVANGQPARLPALSAGLYLAEAQAADGTRASRRVVVE